MSWKYLYMSLFAAMIMIMPGIAMAAADVAEVTYEDGKKQVFKLNRDASLIRRVMFDSENRKDRLVVTYRDDTHQVFMLNAKMDRIKRLVFEGGDAVQRPPAEPKPVTKGSDRWARETYVPSDTELGRVWQVTERCGNIIWTSTWTRRGASNVFDAYWKANTGDKFSGIMEFRELSGGIIELYRSDKAATYKGTLSKDRKRVINGWATWYAPNCQPWYAVID